MVTQVADVKSNNPTLNNWLAIVIHHRQIAYTQAIAIFSAMGTLFGVAIAYSYNVWLKDTELIFLLSPDPIGYILFGLSLFFLYAFFLQKIRFDAMSYVLHVLSFSTNVSSPIIAAMMADYKKMNCSANYYENKRIYDKIHNRLNV